MRVECEGSTIEKKGGEFFYCSSCGCSLHADVNATRNIIDVSLNRQQCRCWADDLNLMFRFV